MLSSYFHHINKQPTHHKIMYDKAIFFLFYPNSHHNFSSLSLSVSHTHSFTGIYCIECVSLVLFSSFCFFSSLLFFALIFLSPRVGMLPHFMVLVLLTASGKRTKNECLSSIRCNMERTKYI